MDVGAAGRRGVSSTVAPGSARVRALGPGVRAGLRERVFPCSLWGSREAADDREDRDVADEREGPEIDVGLDPVDELREPRIAVVSHGLWILLASLFVGALEPCPVVPSATFDRAEGVLPVTSADAEPACVARLAA